MIGRAFLATFGLFSGRNTTTWVGHGLQGLLFGFALAPVSPVVAISFTAGAFLHREVSDFVTVVFETQDWPYPITWSESWQQVREDGLLDLVTPFIGLVLGLVLSAIVFGR